MGAGRPCPLLAGGIGVVSEEGFPEEQVRECHPDHPEKPFPELLPRVKI